MSQTSKSDYTICTIKNPKTYVGGSDGFFTLISPTRWFIGTLLEDYQTTCIVKVIADPQLKDGNYYHQVRLEERTFDFSLVNYTKEGFDCLFKVV